MSKQNSFHHTNSKITFGSLETAGTLCRLFVTLWFTSLLEYFEDYRAINSIVSLQHPALHSCFEVLEAISPIIINFYVSVINTWFPLTSTGGPGSSEQKRKQFSLVSAGTAGLWDSKSPKLHFTTGCFSCKAQEEELYCVTHKETYTILSLKRN